MLRARKNWPKLRSELDLFIETRETYMASIEMVDASKAAQVMAVAKTFADVRAQKLEDIRHPDAKRKNLRVG